MYRNYQEQMSYMGWSRSGYCTERTQAQSVALPRPQSFVSRLFSSVAPVNLLPLLLINSFLLTLVIISLVLMLLGL